MFRVEFFVDDKKLPDVLRAVAHCGGVYDLKPTPAEKSEPIQNGHHEPRSKRQPSSNRVGPLSALDLPATGTKIRIPELRSLLAKIGRSPDAVAYNAKKLVEARRLKSVAGRRGWYEVI